MLSFVIKVLYLVRDKSVPRYDRRLSCEDAETLRYRPFPRSVDIGSSLSASMSSQEQSTRRMILVAKPDETTVSAAEGLFLPLQSETIPPKYQQIRQEPDISEVDMALCAYAVSQNLLSVK